MMEAFVKVAPSVFAVGGYFSRAVVTLGTVNMFIVQPLGYFIRAVTQHLLVLLHGSLLEITSAEQQVLLTWFIIWDIVAEQYLLSALLINMVYYQRYLSY